MVTESAEDVAAAAKYNRIDFGSFFIFLNSYRWLNWALAVLLLYVGATPKMAIPATVAVYGSAFLYNCAFTIWSAKVESALRRLPALLLIDILFCFFLLVVYGWRSPFFVYSFSPVMLAGYLYKVQGGFIAAVLTAAAYGLSVSFNGRSWAQIGAMGEVDSHLFHFFDYFLVAIFFSYPAVLADRLRTSNGELTGAKAEIERLALAKERQRLAGDIHDSATQSLLTIGMILEDAAKTCGDDLHLSKRLGMAKEAAAKALDEIKLAIDDLFEDRHVSRSLSELAKEALSNVEQNHNLATNLVRSGQEATLEGEAKKALFLILQEGLSNVIRHAHASRVDVCLSSKPYMLTMEIVDDGDGFCDSEVTQGYGLRMMARRVEGLRGICQISSLSGQGTRITVTVPIGAAPFDPKAGQVETETV